MKRAVLTLVLAAVVVMSGRAQAPPNLSGTWRPQNPMAGQASPFEFTITQTADSVTIRTPLSNPDTVTPPKRRDTYPDQQRSARLAKQLRHAQPQDRTRNDRVPVARSVQRDSLRNIRIKLLN